MYSHERIAVGELSADKLQKIPLKRHKPHPLRNHAADTERDLKELVRRSEGLEQNGRKGVKDELIELKAEIQTFQKMAAGQIGIAVAILLKVCF